jgi:hypothetical protein
MDFQNLSITRVIIHQVFKRQLDRQIVPPVYGASITNLGATATSALQDRVLAALGSGSKCMEMRIVAASQSSALHLARTLADDDEGLFVDHSKNMANLLASAQTGLSIPGGILVVFAGTANYPPKRVIGVIKAEPHEGFTFENIQGNLALTFLRNLILTPQTRLYKIGAFVEVDPLQSADGVADGWEVYIYDDLMLAGDPDRAAQYFYERFLGCNIPTNAARQTKTFFDLTKKFITSTNIPEGDKIDLNTGLYTYLKVDKAPTLDRTTFANQYLPPDMRDLFVNYMERNQFPATVVAKDLADLGPHLRRRNFVFSSDVRLSAPAERFSELIKIEAIEGDPKPDGSIPQWTRITVRDSIRTEQ